MADFNIIRTEENGVEYFTVVATGECAVSVIGLSKLSGIPRKTLSDWFNNPGGKKASKQPDFLQGKDFYLSHPGGIEKKGGTIKPILVDVAAEIITYAAFDLGKEEAIAVLRAFSKIGLTSFIQSKTGWLPEDRKASPSAHRQIDRILDAPNPWERLYSKEMCDRAFGWFGCQFYWKFCYHFFTPEERCKLERLNPIQMGGRKHKIHQFLEEKTRERLKPRIIELGTLLGANQSKNAFLTSYANLYGVGWQQDLFDGM